jgi:DNA polymerase III sliding clamp (beta) subunit (PCNA family)
VLEKIVSSITKDYVELDIMENEVKISADGTNLSLPIIPGSEFPVLPEQDKELFALTEDQIDELNSLAVPFCSVDNARAVLNGLRIRRVKGKVEFMACDGFRYSYLFSESAGEDFDINIPARSFKELKGLGNVKLWTNADKTQVIIVGDKGTLMSTLLETKGYFELPTYIRSEFDPQSHTRITFGANTLVGPVKLAASVSNEINHQVDLNFKPGAESVSIAAEAMGKGSGTVESKCEIEGQPYVVAFDSNYLMQTLDALKNRVVVMELETRENLIGGSKMPQFTVKGKEGFVHGLLPLTRQNK